VFEEYRPRLRQMARRRLATRAGGETVTVPD
jgi:hypothetical protein